MILRKPYAFLIKHFKLIHTLLTICMVYLLYKSYLIYDFINKFISSGSLSIDYNTTDQLFNMYMFLLPWIIGVILIILLVVMFRKRKPKLFYFINIVIYIATLVIYNYLFDTISYMQNNIISSQSAKLALDITFIITIAQLLSTIISFIRAIGLDLKKFDFGKDLMDLEIDDRDNEEFEVNINVDSSSVKRSFKRNLRYAKYVYFENRVVFNAIAIIAVASISFMVYINISVYNAHYNEGDYFSTDGYSLAINKSYITNRDSRGKTITSNNNSLLILEVSIRTNGTEETINLAKTEIEIENEIYYPVTNYASSLIDVGEAYSSQTLTTEYTKYLLVYEVPTSTLENEISFRFINGFDIDSRSLKPTYIRVIISPVELDEEVTSNPISFNEIIVMNEKTLGNTAITIDSLKLEKEFTNPYNFCVQTNECYRSIEYIKPSLNTNYDKVLLELTGSLTLDENISMSSLKTLKNAINYFGQVEYVTNNKIYKIDSFTYVTPKKYQRQNTYYLELNEAVMSADAAYFVITVRNYEYRFIIFEKDVN